MGMFLGFPVPTGFLIYEDTYIVILKCFQPTNLVFSIPPTWWLTGFQQRWAKTSR
jgi:hypothetical protein